MKDDKTFRSSDNVPPELSAQYRALATEQAPAALREQVMRQAKKAARKTLPQGRFSAWLRPAAFVVTAGLALAVVLEFDDATSLDPAVDLSTRAGGVEPLDGRADSTTDVDALTRSVAGSRGRLKKLNTNASITNPSVEARYCHSGRSVKAEDWWACIEALKERGEFSAVESETALFRATFPDFVPTE